ncbi:MAG: alpha/beta hydrolase [Actinomycetota bacterium]
MAAVTVDGAGVEIAAEVTTGDGTPVVFIHGNSASGATWRHQLDGELGTTNRCIALDLPGHGASGRFDGAEGYSLRSYARGVAEVTSALCDEAPVLVGWSLGGHIALEALTVIQSVRGVMIFGTPPLGMPPDMEQAFLPHPAMGVGFMPDVGDEEAAAYATSFLAPDSPLAIDTFTPDILATDGNARAGLYGSIGAGEFSDELEIVAAMSAPLAIVHGAREQLVAGDYLARVKAPTLWRGSVQVIDEAGHAPHHETVAAFNDLLASFLSEV